jgi:predicted DNA-binding protein with PD1-like motif
MAKTFKTFTKAPTPGSLEAIEAYERGGLGHDTTKPQTHIHTMVSDHDTTEPQTHIHTNVADRDTTKPQAHIPTKVVETTKRLSIDMPASLHRRFKVACTTADKVMVGEVLAFIEQRTAELERS